MSLRIWPSTLCSTSRSMQASQQRKKELQISMPSTAATKRPRAQVGVQHAIALQTPGHFTTQGEEGGRVLALQRVAHGVLAELANPLPQDPPLAFGLQAMQVRDLDRSAQKHAVEHLGPRMRGRLPAFRQGGHAGRPIEDLIQIGFELAPPQGVGLLYFSCSVGFLSRNQRRRFKAVIIAAAF